MKILSYMGGDPILSFNGEYLFLSNFYPSKISYEGYIFPTVEHAYQAAKNPINQNLRKFAVEIITPSQAKWSGRIGDVKPNWNNVKVAVMRELLIKKFSIPDLRAKLLSTEDRYLEEGNSWGDVFWGICPVGSGHGKNMLGTLLMEIREDIKSKQE